MEQNRSTEGETSTDPPEHEDQWIEPMDAARLLQVGPATIYRWIDSGVLPTHRPAGDQPRILKNDLHLFARQRGLPIHPRGRKSPRRVLIVDDEEEYVKTLVARIRALRPDLDLLIAESGFIAGFMVKRYYPELVLLDIRMPGVDGIEVCRTIKWNPEMEQTCVVGMTASRTISEIQSLTDAGAEEVFLKPISPVKLRELLDRVCPPVEA